MTPGLSLIEFLDGEGAVWSPHRPGTGGNRGEPGGACVL